jgi:hypothetical protein
MNKQLLSSFKKSGVVTRFALDAITVIKEIRKYALVHIQLDKKEAIKKILIEGGLDIIAERDLYCRADPISRESILTDVTTDCAANYAEIWIAKSCINQHPTGDELFSNPGYYLGYPECCIKKWESGKSQRDLYQEYLFNTKNGHWELNRLVTLFTDTLLYPDFFPCTLECEHAVKFIRPIINSNKEEISTTEYEKNIQMMKAPLLVYEQDLILFKNWELHNRDLILNTSEAQKVKISSIGDFDIKYKNKTSLISMKHFSHKKTNLYHRGKINLIHKNEIN